MQKAEKRLNAILKKYKSSGIPSEKLATLDIVRLLCDTNKPGNRKKNIGVFFLLILPFFLFAMVTLLRDSECLLEMPLDTSKVFRNPENCGMCSDVTQVDKMKNISQIDFDFFYAAAAKPVVITDGTRGWAAVESFSFDFFKQIYETGNADEKQQSECQFFPYKTEFNSLEEVLNMDENRSRLDSGTKHWYVGWSNCDNRAGEILREYYQRPYFLPKTSENIALSWIFMGGPGAGAHMHVDNVHYPSWQAQLSGRKKWRLAPPPECFYKCQEVQVTVERGEIIVVDTNRWYHETQILPEEISITIGSEFD